IHVIEMATATLPPANSTNCVTIGEREIYVIDPGSPAAEEQALLKTQLDRMLELGERVAAVLLTHSHGDHIGAAEFVRREFGAPIWADAITAERIDITVDKTLSDGETIDVAGEPDWRLRWCARLAAGG
ncbi:MAG: MBL fold metallo-hydrolase, partial [Proteobacteria bacterium]|nr:MBL fold metallo-hydrolase [Pseudomonadota bacterium]